ncbi:LytR/AlgR family response regulator transcription factor [Runella aurantiaca]|uniref:DNA-binding response regulator n=1 Tax=Runella aurantiaca TaxID=2282308 RepID=A0A369IBT0_9BACT|nr:LytTR family DNA-binding domain-containing protein [Runella aurantiaca]RDB07108.1 DNA-binding response regulator [Runella aurantiaca]
MTLTCVVVEDEPLARNLLEQYILKVSHLQLVKSFSNPLTALEFLRNNSVDILFSDIQMPEITGISLLKILPKKPLVILTTAYSEYAIEGYELDVLDYLLKPITLERFLKSVEKATQRLSTAPPSPALETAAPIDQTQASIFVKDGTKLVKIRLNEILYIEGLKDYVTIHTKEKKVVTLQTLKSLEAQLTPHHFIRVHHSFLVSFDAIDTIEKEKIQIGKVWIPISDTYRKSVKEFIERKQS